MFAAATKDNVTGPMGYVNRVLGPLFLHCVSWPRTQILVLPDPRIAIHMVPGFRGDAVDRKRTRYFGRNLLAELVLACFLLSGGGDDGGGGG